MCSVIEMVLNTNCSTYKEEKVKENPSVMLQIEILELQKLITSTLACFSNLTDNQYHFSYHAFRVQKIT